jgi:hypothetical protein
VKARPNQLASANSRRPFCFRMPEQIRCSHVLSGLGSPAAVAERGRWTEL